MPSGRIEMKFLLRRDAYLILRDTLRHLGTPDRYAGSTGVYPVFSQYYDTEKLGFFYDKMDGEWEHVKIRVRQYAQEFGKEGSGFLEAKIKHNNWQNKIRIPVDDVRRLKYASEWDKIDHPEMEYFVGTNLESELMPTCNVYYEREAYTMHEGVDTFRFNFDTNIAFLYPRETTMTSELLDRRRMLKEHGCVLEVKSATERLPRILQHELLQVGARITTFSKYTTALLRLDEWNRHNEVHV